MMMDLVAEAELSDQNHPELQQQVAPSPDEASHEWTNGVDAGTESSARLRRGLLLPVTADARSSSAPNEGSPLPDNDEVPSLQRHHSEAILQRVRSSLRLVNPKFYLKTAAESFRNSMGSGGVDEDEPPPYAPDVALPPPYHESDAYVEPSLRDDSSRQSNSSSPDPVDPRIPLIPRNQADSPEPRRWNIPDATFRLCVLLVMVTTVGLWVYWLVGPIVWLASGRFSVGRSWDPINCTVVSMHCTRQSSFGSICGEEHGLMLSPSCIWLAKSEYNISADGTVTAKTESHPASGHSLPDKDTLFCHSYWIFHLQLRCGEGDVAIQASDNVTCEQEDEKPVCSSDTQVCAKEKDLQESYCQPHSLTMTNKSLPAFQNPQA
eukprot:CAMPEP_0181347586 /NCGR_PEP_ID=MMETSP1101-20121128/33958_1 /TAXON_ID=46948 /ORGANISM="Rhodomonas abbreviata, Strain Caron Lab Isolate" /LENGTH=377 /DNA_ID=CAMNT_0023459811 /DNA_START=61 /DNA_END=1191 /DNA_ORIENTATION=+